MQLRNKMVLDIKYFMKKPNIFNKFLRNQDNLDLEEVLYL